MELTIKVEVNGTFMRLSDPDSDFYMMTSAPEGGTFSDKLIGEHITLYLHWYRKYLEEKVDRDSQSM